MNILQRLLAPAAGKVEIEICRNVFVGGSRYEVGEVASFDPATAKELCSQGAGFDPRDAAAAQVRQSKLAALLPPPGTARPVPDGWDKLPSCFAQWHELNEKGLLLIHRAGEIEERLMARMTKRVLPSLRGVENLPVQDQRRVISGINFSVGEIPPDVIEADRHLRDALERATKAVQDWREANATELLRLRIACSDYAQAAHGKLVREIRELHAMALDLFSSRIAALGLSEIHVARLFMGSADSVRFAAIPAPDLQQLRLAWIEESGEPRYYLDRPPSVMAELIAGWEATGAEVAKLSKQAQAELSKARKVSQAA